MRNEILWGALACVLFSGCASQWKIHGGPEECAAMCAAWGMKLVGMVGVGDQGRAATGGATACVCEVRDASAGTRVGSAGVSASTGAVAVMLAEQARQAQQQQEQQQARR